AMPVRSWSWRLLRWVVHHAQGDDMTDPYTPQPEHHFTFGLWTVGNVGRDPFGDAVRTPVAPPRIVRELAKLGVYGVNLHDNDLLPRDASVADRDRIVREFKAALDETGMKVPM